MTSRPSSSPRSRNGDLHVALLRGINVGGKNKLAMSDLAKCFADVGCFDVQTYIQSGNVIFRASRACAMTAATEVCKQLTARFGLSCPVVLRTAHELRNAIACNPFSAADTEAGLIHLAFLADEPDAELTMLVDSKRSPGDSFRILGKHVYLRLPNGVGKTKLTNAWFDSKLKTVSTVRNWRTVMKLMGLCDLWG